MTARRYAILIGASVYKDPHLQDLSAAAAGLDGLKAVLNAQGDFDDIKTSLNESSKVILRAVDHVFKRAKRDDFVLVYYCGHGAVAQKSILHLTTSETVMDELPFTAVPWDRIAKMARGSRSGSVVIILDCAFSGAAFTEFM